MTRTLGDRYELGRRIASGGMADVHAAHDLRLDRPVAVKLLRAEVADPGLRARFAREALTVARVAHPNVVSVYDVGEADNHPYLVMELVDGPSLSQILARRSALPTPEALDIARQILDALTAAHAEGIVHRDVKPGNILLDAHGRAKLADFGIAKAVADTTTALTAVGQVVGTPKYLSPEQVTGQPGTPRSDLYAMGVVLYEMLTGSPPFDADSAVALALAHRQAPVPPLASQVPGIPPALDHAVARALAKDPAERHVDAERMRSALDDAADATVAVTGLNELDRTAVLEAPAAIDRRRSRLVRVALAGLAAAALLGAAALLLSDRDGSAPVIADPAADPTPGTGNETATDPPADESEAILPESPPSDPEPQTVGELVGMLATDAGAHGEKGRDLVDDLLELTEEDPEDVPEEAAKLIDEVDKWVEDGELDPGIGALTVRVLEPLAADFQRRGGPDRD